MRAPRQKVKISVVVQTTPLELISPTFCEQLLRPYSFAKKLQSQIASGEKQHKTFSYTKAGRKMLVKLPPQRRQKQMCGKSNHKKVCKADQTQHNVTQSKRRLMDAAEILLQQLLGNLVRKKWSEYRL